MPTVIAVENLAKLYRLGQVGTGSLAHDLNRWWHRIRGNEDPYTQVGQVNDRTKKRDSDWVWSLKDVNFEVQQGEVLGIIGRNGAGKSTLLKILSRVTAPTAGKVSVRGRIASLLEVGTGFHPELTGRENIYLNGAILGMRKREIDGKFDEIVDFSGCEAYMDTAVKRYSSGMQVRLGFAVAAHLDPEILVVDEVLAVGDAEFQKKCLGKMRQVSHSEGRTVLFVSHNMTSVQNLCGRVLWLAEGAVVDQGPTGKMIDQYFASGEQLTRLPLALRTDREGTQQARITRLTFSAGGQTPNVVRASGEVIVEIEYQSEEPVRQAVVGVGIYDQRLTKIAHLSSAVGPESGPVPPSGLVRCRLPSLPLNFGEYSINVSLHSGSSLLDRVEQAAQIEVVETDFFENGRKIPRDQGLVLLEQNWEWQSGLINGQV